MKWEYRIVDAAPERITVKMLDELGREQWGLVKVIHLNGDNLRLIFKRPITEQPQAALDPLL